LFESLCRTGSRTVASLFSRFAGILEEYNSNRRAKRNVINKSKKMQGTNYFFFRIANYAEIRVKGWSVKKKERCADTIFNW